MTPDDLMASFGYLALFLGTVLEGETVVVMAVMLAISGHLEMPWVLAVAFSGAVAGDQCCFFLGRTQGARFLARHPRWQARSRRVTEVLSRWETVVMVGYRFVYGFRAVTPFVIGMNGFGIRRFVVLSLAGTLLWLTVLGSLVVFFGDLALGVLSGVRQGGVWLAGALVALVALIWFLRRCRRG